MFNKINNNLKCKYCGSSYDNLLRYGYYCINNNSDNKEIIKIQKYKCKCCNKVFSDKEEDKRYKLTPTSLFTSIKLLKNQVRSFSM